MQNLTSKTIKRLGLNEIQSQLARCPSLPSLSSINKSLLGLVLTEHRYTAQIGEIISRDPSLTSRLLRLVNSVYYGLSTPVTSIEEAVFYLGIRQIRQLTLVTPVIEDFQKLTSQCAFPWREFWQHCIGTGILTHEIAGVAQATPDDSDYIAGLVHDVGKIVMAWAFPDHFTEIHRLAILGTQDLIEIENSILGMDHAELGALYMERHRMSELLIQTARYHHSPEKAQSHGEIIASVQIADLLIRCEKMGCSGNYLPVTSEQCFAASGWKVLYPDARETEQAIARASLSRTLELMPRMLEGLV
ncbi:MAG: HDOD domain-containing protein [Verrucomicrobiota bacterium]